MRIPSNVTSRGTGAFNGCTRIISVTSYPSTPPSAFSNSFANYNAYLYVPCNSKMQYDLDTIFGSFKYIECVGSETVNTTNEVIVIPGANNVQFTWPMVSNVASYTLQITKDEVVFCTLTFNADGQLMGIAFAPSMSGNDHDRQNASATVSGYQFSVTGLDEASNYAYTLNVKDVSNNIIKSYSGTFQTGVATVIHTIEIEDLYVDKGLVVCPEPFEIYTISGLNVTKRNGNLSSGIYIVKTETVSQKIVVN